MDQDEALKILEDYLTTHSGEQAFDQILVPALNYAKADLHQNKITEREGQFIYNATREILDYLASDPKLSADSENGAPSASVEQPVRKIHVVGCPAHDEADEVALLIFRQLIDPMRYDVEVLSASILVSEMTAAVAEKKPPLVCISALPPGGLVQACHLCKRLRALFPRIKIVVGRWSSAGALDDSQNSLLAAGADQVGSSLLQTRDQLLNLRQFIS